MSPRFAQILFFLLLSGIMSLSVSGVSTLHMMGFSDAIFGLWMANWTFSWLVAFPTAVIVAPIVRRLVARLTKEG